MSKITVYLAVLVAFVVIAESNGQSFFRLCPLRQTWVDCPSSCPPTCSVPNPGPCIQVCRQAGCVCDQGYVRNGNNCVRLQDCPRVGK